ncbi:M13 family metallopeptidase [Nannocystis radixulma]|uniref:M13 family metallopeptidase n=1 Tax=Nannocystis radixulma TaxID=2995305 RepID=A0ABT5BP88_9BACT|nr:M13 family metallopeptidase [Nannocystis radixulma]MDC0675513.1 M13 family metallopeptidase [Nannocystis radixulma]
MDPTVDPCVDFYHHACGGWLASTPRPPDKPIYGRGFQVLGERNNLVLREILEAAARGEHRRPGDDKLGAVWQACMDEEKRDQAGVTPLAPGLAVIERVKDQASLMRAIGELHRDYFMGFGPLWYITVEPDARNPDRYVARFQQGGLGLPGREFYREPAHAEIRAAYQRHVARMLGFLGEAPATADALAAKIVAFETELANRSVSLAELRQLEKVYNPLGVTGLKALDRATPWSQYFGGLGYPNIGPDLHVMTPNFFRELGPLLRKTDIATVRAYLRWQLLRGSAVFLSRELVAAEFEFTRVLTGAKELPPVWERCVEIINVAMGEQVGQGFVERKFAGESKAIALEMIDHVERAFAAGLEKLSWMDPDTRARANEKLGTLTNKIGYPEPWLDYGPVSVSPTEHMRNMFALATFLFVRHTDRIGKAVDRREWRMAPAVVNAYYDRANEMVFPAGALQPPFFSREFPMAMNFGAIGMAMGHELVHGFDDIGRNFDARGVLREWWQPAAVQRFEAQTRCIENLYGGIEVLPGVKLDGKQTLGENIADFGGIKVAQAAYRSWRRERQEPPRIDGVSDDQLFFLGYAQAWCTQVTDEQLRLQVATDTHSPEQQRVNVPLAHLPAFWEAYQCAPGTPMHAGAAACEVW